MKIAIIGCGQLGSRHLQACALLSNPIELFVVEPSSESLQIAMNRWNEACTSRDIGIHLATSCHELPEHLDFAVIATSSGQRLTAMEQLLDRRTVKYLVLEKVLFQDLPSYSRAHELLQDSGTLAWVNTPRRSFEVYQKVKKNIDSYLTMDVSGNSWGLAGNAIHFIDLYSYITGDLDLSISTESLDSVVHESKRCGYIELTGRLEISSEHGSCVITSRDHPPCGVSLQFKQPGSSIIVLEGANAKFMKWDESNRQVEDVPMTIPLQSQMTNKVIEELWQKNSCSLTTFSDSSRLHIAYIESLLKHLSNIEGKRVHLCPIT